MHRLVLAIILTLVVMYVTAFVVYGTFAAVAGLKPPTGVSPARFLVSILVVKVGIAVAFVLIFYFARGALGQRWLLYAFLWWLLFVLGEIGQALGPNYSWTEAVAGIISESIYCPAAALVTKWLVETGDA